MNPEPLLVIVGAGRVLHLPGNMLATLCGVERRWTPTAGGWIARRRGVWRSEYPSRPICVHCTQVANMRVDEWRTLGVLP